MPTYEYRCKACGHHLEIVQGFNDDALTTCPDCGAEQLRKVFAAPGIAFKGSGFYKTDSRGKTSSTAAASSSNGDGSGSSDKGSADKGSSSESSTTSSSTTSGTSEAKSA